MRLDKYLKVSRIIKRRTVAKEAADSGRIKVNGKDAKSSTSLKVGDVLEIKFGEEIKKVKILIIKETVKKEEAENMYEVL
ncbi:MAG: RNA-binding S4 domain-containing protein [Clostridia bacterium]|jgi:ribosomal 50S subunit-recycling heat shock protein|nr:RNA-binding S4 domain-containing protein [Clostridia bacterium]